MNKSKVLKGESYMQSSGFWRLTIVSEPDTFVAADVRNYHAHKLLASSARSLIQYLYPPLMSLHDLNQTIALPDPVTGRIKIPSLMRSSHIFMSSNGVYLLGAAPPHIAIPGRGLTCFSDNGEVMMIWVGNSVSPQILLDLFGVDDFNSVDPRMVSFIVPVVQP